MESYDAAAAGGVQDIDEIAMLSDRVGLASAGGYAICESQVRPEHTEGRQRAASSIRREQDRPVITQGQRSLRGQGIYRPPTSSAAGLIASWAVQRPILRAFIGDDFVRIGIVRHYENGMLRR